MNTFFLVETVACVGRSKPVVLPRETHRLKGKRRLHFMGLYRERKGA